MRAGFIGVQKQVFVMAALVPIRPQHHPFASIDRAVPCFPRFHMIYGQEEVGVGAALCGKIQHIDRGDQALHRQGVGVAVGVVLAGDPVMGGIKVGARMFAQFKPVPRPEWAVLIIFADRVDLDWWGVLGKVRRQFQQRCFWPQNPGAINYLDPTRGKHSGQTRQHIRGTHLRLPDLMVDFHVMNHTRQIYLHLQISLCQRGVASVRDIRCGLHRGWP